MAGARPGVERRRWIALIVLCLGQLMIVLDVTIVNVALPSIQRELHFSHASLAWVVNAYMISFAGLLLLAGRLGDLFGRKRVFVVGLCTFTAASALCGASQSEAMLILARLLQGIGGAFTGSVIVAIIAASFPNQPHRGQAMGIFAFTGAAGGSIGLLAGGALTQALSWHWIFLVNVPIGLLVVPLAVVLIESDSGPGLIDGVDALGATLITAALMIGSYAIVEASSDGWGSTVTLGGGGVAVALVALFGLRESWIAHPLIPLRIFRSRNVAGANLARALQQFGLYGTMFLLAVYLQEEMRYTPLQTGLAFLPQTVLIAAVTLVLTTRLINLVGPKLTAVPGLALLAVGLLTFARLPAHGNYVTDVLPGVVLIGVGGALSYLPLVILSMAGVPAADYGAASGMINVSQQIGAVVGVALLATLSSRHVAAVPGHTPAGALLGGYHLAFIVAASIVAADCLIIAFVPSARSAQTATIEPPPAPIGPAGGWSEEAAPTPLVPD